MRMRIGFLSLLPVAALALSTSCGPPRDTLPVLGEIPDFQLIAQTGQPLTGAMLRGKPWVANFIFTTCTGPCPRNSFAMSKLQAALGAMPEVRLVSFSVDPEHDTPPVLAEYAARYKAKAGRWFFLTGDASTIDSLNRDAFHLGTGDGDHSTRWTLIDAQGRIRAYYRTSDGAPVEQVIADLKRLRGERS